MALLALLSACARPALDGPDGLPGAACTFRRDDTSLLISCEDGSLATVRVGPKGETSPAEPGEAGEDYPTPPQIFVSSEESPPDACRTGAGFLLRVSSDQGVILDERLVCRPAPPCGVVHGGVTFTDALRLLSFASAGCTELRGRLEIRSVGGLRELPRFTSSGWSAGGLRIRDNRNLRSISTLISLKGTIDSLEITDNPALDSLQGLENVERVRGPFRVTGNTSLKLCEVERIRDLIGTGRIAGPIEIEGIPGECPR